MRTEVKWMTIEALVNWREKGFMTANPEYQRGEVWNLGQKRRLIDSIFRDYQLPIIYLHDIKRVEFGMVQERLEIIDGQQRINALHQYWKGGFPLYQVDDSAAKLPAFLHDTDKHPCPWGGKDFDGLPEECKTELLESNFL